jgi:hypothetical protein
MGTRIFFVVIALLLVTTGVWAYHHDQELHRNVMQVNLGDPNEVVRELLGDPNEVVRELLGDPNSEGPCGSLTAVPNGCADEYVYRYYYSPFNPQYEVVWFNHSGKVLGMQHVQRP